MTTPWPPNAASHPSAPSSHQQTDALSSIISEHEQRQAKLEARQSELARNAQTLQDTEHEVQVLLEQLHATFHESIDPSAPILSQVDDEMHEHGRTARSALAEAQESTQREAEQVRTAIEQEQVRYRTQLQLAEQAELAERSSSNASAANASTSSTHRTQGSAS